MCGKRGEEEGIITLRNLAQREEDEGEQGREEAVGENGPAPAPGVPILTSPLLLLLLVVAVLLLLSLCVAVLGECRVGGTTGSP